MTSYIIVQLLLCLHPYPLRYFSYFVEGSGFSKQCLGMLASASYAQPFCVSAVMEVGPEVRVRAQTLDIKHAKHVFQPFG